jgi:hypothetical protein
MTWWFIQFVVSLSTIVTASVISIPTDTLGSIVEKKTGSDASWWDKKMIPEKITYDNNTA